MTIFAALFAILSIAGCAGVVNPASGNSPGTTTTPAAIAVQPTSQSVAVGQSVTFIVTATGTAPLSYQWRKNGTNISTATTSSYTTPAVTADDDGAKFDVVVSNSMGSAISTAATLNVSATTAKPAITKHPSNQAVSAGQTATFTVEATGTPTPTYQWRRNSTSISGATSATYKTPATVSGDNGAKFDVVVSNSEGSVTSNAATLTVSAAAIKPAITTQPASKTVITGQMVTFSVVATGTPTPTYQWRKNSTNIGSATSASYTTPATTSGDNGAKFDVVVRNSAGSVTSNAATLTVSAAAVKPAITTQPASKTVTTGQTATFSVAATGAPAPTYQWRKNSANIGSATSASYTTPPTASGDNGAKFDVVVSNSAGSVTSSAATLTVNAPASVAPKITTQPVESDRDVGQTATFTVVATGTPTPTYQWRKDGASISGATSATYVTPATVADDSGTKFDVVISNSVGSRDQQLRDADRELSAYPDLER